MSDRLEAISERIRNGEPVSIDEAVEAIDYQDRLRNFDRQVARIGRREAIKFFAWRIAIGAAILYFGIAAYGRWGSP